MPNDSLPPWPLIVGLATVAVGIVSFSEMRLHGHESLAGHPGVMAEVEGVKREMLSHHNEVHTQLERRFIELSQRVAILEQGHVTVLEKEVSDLRERLAMLEKELKYGHSSQE